MNNSLMTLEEYRKSHPMDLDTVLQIGLDICSSLESGLPHGEISASGICVTADWKFVFDTGKSVKEPDMASDIYALGMLMYRLLNKGRLPFMPPYPEKVTKRDKEEAIERCLSGELFPIPLEGNEQITEVLQRACHMDRDMRFQSPGEMHMALASAVIPQNKEVPDLETEQSFMEVPESAPENLEDYEEEETSGKKRKEKKPSKLAKFQIVFVLLAAILSGAYVFMTKNLSLAESGKLLQIGFSAAQIVLLILATRSKIFLKLLGLLALADGFCTITADLFLVRVLDGMGRELPRFYTPGYMIVVLPVVIAVFYLVGCLFKEELGHLKNRFYGVFIAITSLLMLLLSITGINKMILTLELYPYVTGIIIIVFGLLAMENKVSGIPVRVLSFLDICLAIGVMVIHGFAEMVQALGIPTSLVEKVMLAVLLLFAVIIFFISGKRDDDEDDEEEED